MEVLILSPHLDFEAEGTSARSWGRQAEGDVGAVFFFLLFFFFFFFYRSQIRDSSAYDARVFRAMNRI